MLAEPGFDLMLNDIARPEEDLQGVRGEVGANRRRCSVALADVSKKAEVEAAVEEAVRETGSIDAVVNRAGILISNFVEVPAERQRDSVPDVNAEGTFLVTRVPLPHMRARRQGRTVHLRVSDIHLGDSLRLRATVIQQRTGRPVPFELTDPTRDALTAWLKACGLRGTDWLFPSRSHTGGHITPRRYSPLVGDWVALAGLDPAACGTRGLRRTKVAPVYKRTGNLRACRLPLGHATLESTVRYLGIEVDDAFALSAQADL